MYCRAMMPTACVHPERFALCRSYPYGVDAGECPDIATRLLTSTIPKQFDV